MISQSKSFRFAFFVRRIFAFIRANIIDREKKFIFFFFHKFVFDFDRERKKRILKVIYVHRKTRVREKHTHTHMKILIRLKCMLFLLLLHIDEFPITRRRFWILVDDMMNKTLNMYRKRKKKKWDNFIQDADGASNFRK